MKKHCLVLKILCSLINLCWMHFPFSEMLLSAESTAGAVEHYQSDFRLKCFTQSCLGSFLHQNNLPISLRIIQMPWCPLLLLFSQLQGYVMLNLGLEVGLVRRSLVEILSLYDVIPGYLECTPQSLLGVQCLLDPWNDFHKVQLMVCHNQMTPGAGILLRTHEYPEKHSNSQILKPNQRAADTQLWCWQPRWCFFSPSSAPCYIGWYNHNWAEMGTQTALLCWDQPAQVHTQVQPHCALSCYCFLLLAPSPPSHSNSISGPRLTMLVIILLPGCEKTTLISVFWRSPLPATLDKMLQEADVRAQGSGAERRVLENTPWDSWAKCYLLFPLRAHKRQPSQSNLWGGPFSFCLSQQKNFCPSGSEQGFH